MPEPNEMLEIAPAKVAHIIMQSGGTGAGAFGQNSDAASADTDASQEIILEDLGLEASKPELKPFLEALNEGEWASLIALAWIGRGTYAPGEIGEAIAAARANHRANATAYLLSLPLLPEYLEDGLEQVGVFRADKGVETLPSGDL